VLAAGLEHVPGTADVDLERLDRRAAGRADDRLGGEVEDRVAAADRLRDRLLVAEIRLGELDLTADPEQVEGGPARPPDVRLAGVGTVEDPDAVATVEQRLRQVRADEAVRAGDQGRQGVASIGVSQGASPRAQRSSSTTASL
jgi:hypothetical protein